jgi:hypothetical protein
MRNSSAIVSHANAGVARSQFIVVAYRRSWRFVFHLSPALPYIRLWHNEASNLFCPMLPSRNETEV